MTDFKKKVTAILESTDALKIETKALRAGRFSFRALLDGMVVASGEFQSNTMTNTGSVEDITVHPDYRRRGIATAIYDHFESMGYKVVPSDDVKPDGQRFWDARGRW